MFVKDFKASILACKDCKINMKTLKTLPILLILCFSVFRSLGLFALCSHPTEFSSLSTAVLLFVISIDINNLHCTNRVLWTCGHIWTYLFHI